MWLILFLFHFRFYFFYLYSPYSCTTTGLPNWAPELWQMNNLPNDDIPTNGSTPTSNGDELGSSYRANPGARRDNNNTSSGEPSEAQLANVEII